MILIPLILDSGIKYRSDNVWWVLRLSGMTISGGVDSGIKYRSDNANTVFPSLAEGGSGWVLRLPSLPSLTRANEVSKQFEELSRSTQY